MLGPFCRPHDEVYSEWDLGMLHMSIQSSHKVICYTHVWLQSNCSLRVPIKAEGIILSQKHLTPEVTLVNTMWMKTLTISLFNNSKKLVQILLDFSQQMVEDYELVLAKFWWKEPSIQPKSATYAKIRVTIELFGLILRLCTKCNRSVVCKKLELTVAHCRAWRAY